MDFNKISYLIAVAELKSFSKAAERCFISQPALTRCIKNIEKEIGLQLFDRSRSPICLTYAGERYLAGMRDILARKIQLDQEMADIASRRKERLTLGIPTTRSATWIPRVLPAFAQECPNVDIKIIEGNSVSLEKSLESGAIDLYFCCTAPVLTNGLELIPLFRENMMLVISRQAKVFHGYELPPNRPGCLQYIPPELLKQIPFISATPSNGSYYFARRVFDQYDIQPETLLEMINTTAAYHLAPGAKAFAFAPVTVSYEEQFSSEPIFCSPSDKLIYRMFGIMYNRSRPFSAAAEKFIQVATQEIQKYVKNTLMTFKVSHDIDWKKR